MRIEPLAGRDADEMVKQLREIFRDDDRWTALFIDDRTGQLWLLSFPQSEMHGGGPSLLEPTTSEVARQEFPVELSDFDTR